MAVPVIMPKLEMAQETATVVEWLKQEGERVEKGEPLLTVETDKVTLEIESPASGILAGVRVGPQQVVPVTEVIAYILQPGEELPREAEAPSPPPPPPTLPVAATPVAQRLAAARGVDLSTIVGTGPGGRITKADVEAALAAPSRPAVEPSPEKVRATPAARRIARERGVDLSAVTGSGPQGRIQAADVLAFTQAPAGAPAPVAEIIPLQGMRRTIAERMTTSYRTTPHITFTVRVDMSRFEEARARLNARAEAAGQPHVSATALIVKAVAWALRQHPWLNSTLHDEEIHLLPEVNVGVAVALEEGLIVPVVHQADRKSVTEIAAEMNDLVTRAREGRLTPADVAGGTFTVSNLGPFGIEQFTAIINPPQAAILAVGATQLEPVVDEEGQVVVRPVMRMTLSADHRVVDGARAARFLTDLREALEAPTLILW
ncbi:MAG TPA: 2-oxo acid dehydrogenase subunit E2 [Thermoflexia bacterium]|nr:2-oxo acid dehydrogenase subunit E2 [Thermoflexia bacterium]